MRLALRNAVAEAIVAALAARAELAGLRALEAALAPAGAVLDQAGAHRLVASGAFVAASGGRVGVRPELAGERAAARERVARGRAVAECYWSAGGPGGRAPEAGRSACRPVAAADAVAREARRSELDTALVQGALLFNAGLFFEVHEVLEAVWQRLAGAPQRFVQGLIQIAVALHHLQNGNRAGARALFAAGRAKLAPHVPAYQRVAVEELLKVIEPWERAAATDCSPPDLAAPIMRLR